MPLIEISLEFFLTKLQNVLLIAILIFLGRTFQKRKARDELCRVVGSEKTRNRKSTRKKVKKKQWFLDFNLPLCFRPNPETGVAPFHNRSNPCFRVWPEMHWNPLIQILREISAFLPVSLTSVTLVKNGWWGVFWISTSRKFQTKPSNTGRAH